MFMHREGIWVIHPTLCFSPRIRSKVFSNTMQHFIIFTGDQRCWDHEGSDWSQAVQSHPGSRVEVTGHQCQEMTYCQGCWHSLATCCLPERTQASSQQPLRARLSKRMGCTASTCTAVASCTPPTSSKWYLAAASPRTWACSSRSSTIRLWSVTRWQKIS